MLTCIRNSVVSTTRAGNLVLNHKATPQILYPVLGPSLKSWSVSSEGQWSWWRVSNINAMKSGSRSWGCLAWRKEGSQKTLSLSVTASKEGCSQVEVSLFSQATSDRRRGNGLKMCQRRLRLGIRKYLYSGGVVKHWTRLLSEVWSNHSLGIHKMWHFQRWFSGHAGIQSKVGLDDFGGLFQPWWFH